MAWKTLDDIDLAGKGVLVRVDINVPVEDGRVTDATRIERIVPTIRDILAKGGKPVLLAHFGRPKGKVVPEMSLKVTLPALEAALGQPVAFADDCIGAAAAAAVRGLPAGGVLLLENTRFHKGEEENDPEFAEALAALGDVYCNDAFSAAHRAHASTEALARLLPACAGRLMQAELEALEKALGRPGAAGGRGRRRRQGLDQARAARQPDRQGRHAGDRRRHGQHLPRRAGASTSASRSASTTWPTRRARSWPRRAAAAARSCCRPTWWSRASSRRERRTRPCAADACPPDAMILDAGPEAVARIAAVFEEARTLVWNGPLGAFEIPPFNAATDAAAPAGGRADAGRAGCSRSPAAATPWRR